MSEQILIVEDSKTQALRLQLLFEDLGWNALVKETGKDAFESISKNIPRLIILDYRLPDMFGFQLCRQIRTLIQLRSIPILILTEDETEKAMIDGLESGADAFLKKDVSDEVLLARVRALMGGTPENSNSAISASLPQLQRWKVLIVDDSPTYCEHIRTVLEASGFEVDIAISPKEGLKKIAENNYEMALVDLIMPEMNGIEFIEYILNNFDVSNTAFALLSGNEKDNEVVKGLSAGAEDFIFKSHSPEIIIKRCQALIRRRELLNENASLNEKIIEQEMQKKLAENEAKAANQISDFKSNFLSKMSHEIRTPMNSVIGMASLLGTTEQTEEQEQYCHAIKTAGETLISIINDILDLSKLQAGKMRLAEEEFDLLKTVSDAVEMFSESTGSKNLELLSFVSNSIPLLIGDHLRIRQIFINLLGNAVKFTESGAITIRAQAKNVNGNEIEVLCEITDTGVGIPPDDQNKVFDAFEQSSQNERISTSGTGLGLAICKTLVSAMSGEIGLRSELGKGSTFWFTMKLMQASNSENSISENLILKNKKILIVSSNEYLLDTMHEQLDSWGLETKGLSSADAAMEELKQHSLDNEYKLAIIDYEISGMGGLALGELIKKETTLKEIKMIMLCPYGKRYRGFDKDVEKSGFTAVVGKPIIGSLIKKRILICLDQENSLSHLDTSPQRRKEDLFRTDKKTVLLVDDNEPNCRLGKKMIEKCGHSPILATDGESALKILAETTIDIVFMDCQMPILDGFEATKAFRKREDTLQRLPIVALTAGVMDGYEHKCQAAGMDDFLAKPITLQKFKEMLGKWLPAEEESNEESISADSLGDVIDLELYNDLRELSDEPDSDFLVEHFTKFMVRADELVAEIKENIDNIQFTKLEHAAHALNGSAGSVGATGLRTCCAKLELHASQGKLDGSEELFSQIVDELDRVKTFIYGEINIVANG